MTPAPSRPPRRGTGGVSPRDMAEKGMANAPQSRATLSGGFLLAASVMIGTIFGAWKGQPSMGFVGGFAVGLALAVGVWLYDKNRR